MSEAENVEGVCVVCDRPAKQRCAACHEVFYCSREHQKLDWGKGHKKNCQKLNRMPSFSVCNDSEALGRYALANHDIKAGELILREEPIIEAPSQFTFPVCAICYQYLTANTARPCDKCGWPVCSNAKCWQALTQNDSVHQAECQATQAATRRVNIVVFEQEHPSYQSVAILRCLSLKQNCVSKYETLMTLESHCEERKKSPRYEAEKSSVGFLLNFMKLVEKGITEEEIMKLCGILQVNGHEIPTTEPPHMAVYAMASLLEHSCFPNCVKRFIPGKKNSIIEIRALQDIKKGEHLTISYSDPLWCTVNRRMQLRETKFFDCKCPRCTDPHELGSNMSGVRCQSTPKCPGFQYPNNPLDDNSLWKCEVCEVETSSSQIEEVLGHVGIELSTLTAGDCDTTESFVSRISGSVLHPNHQFVIDARLALIQMWGRRCGDAGLGAEPDYVVVAKLAACELLKALVDIVAPGTTALRGLILLEYQSAKAEEARRRLLCGELDPSGLRTSLMESRHLLLEAVNILKMEAASPQDKEQADRGRKALSELDIFIQALPRS